MTRKEIAISFLQLAGSGQVEEAFREYTSPDFLHHNQYFEGTKDALKKGMIEAHETVPNKSIEVKYCYEAEEHTVITHSHVLKEHLGIAVVHIFRFKSDKIVEMWDLGQVIENESPNKNGLF